MKTKEAFHALIDQIEDESLLESYLLLFQRLNDRQTGPLWESLTSEQKLDLLLAYEESMDEANLISHEEMRDKHSKWLLK
jgi:hypothetical protein